MQRFLAVCLIVLIAGMIVPAAAQAQQVVNRVVAVVDDDVITSQDVSKMVARLDAALKPARDENEKEMRKTQLERMAVETLIEERMLIKEAKRLNITISDREVNGYIERLQKNNNLTDEEFRKRLSSQGVSYQDYREDLRSRLLKHRVLTREVHSQVVISDEQVEEFLKEQGKGPVESEEVTVRALFLKIPENPMPESVDVLRKKAEELKNQAMEKDNMAELADKNSEGPGAGKGGMLGPLAVADLLPPMRQALIGLKEGDYSKVIEVPGSLVFMQLVKRSKKTITVSDEAKAQIRIKLEDEARQRKFEVWMKDLKSKTYIKIMDKK
jgi:peptidyl-prolyl cis-trans isomerase SurA